MTEKHRNISVSQHGERRGFYKERVDELRQQINLRTLWATILHSK
jgi:hypothetical protein